MVKETHVKNQRWHHILAPSPEFAHGAHEAPVKLHSNLSLYPMEPAVSLTKSRINLACIED